MKTSIKLVLTAFVILSVTIAALVAFLPLYFTGLESVESAVDTVRASIIDRSKDNVQAYFKQGTDAVEAVSRATYYGTLNFQDSWENQPRIDLVNFLYSILAKNNGTYTTASLLSPTPAWSLKVDSRVGRGGVGTQTVLTYTNTTYFINEVWRNIPGDTKNTTFVTDSDININFPFPRATMSARELAIMNAGQPSWGYPIFSYDDVSIAVGAPTYVNRVATGAFTLSMLPRDINLFLGRIGLREGGRAMVFDARTPEGTVIGNSWGQPGGVHTGTQAFSGERTGILLPLTNLTDPLMNKVIDTYGLSQIINGTVPFQRTMGKKENDRTYVDIIAVTDEYGLDLRVVVAMPLIDFLGDFYTSRSIVIGILVAAVVVLAVSAALFAVLLTRPLDRLGARMYLTASLKDTGEDDQVSALSEIANMQEAYQTMKVELTRMKSFLPQSLFQHDNEDELDTASESGKSSLTTVPANPLRRNSHDGVAIAVDSTFAQAGVDASRLRTENNVFASVDCAIALVSVAYHAPPGTAAYTASVEELLAAVVTMAGRHRGVVEQMRPQQVLVTFGGRRRIANPALCALKFALALHKLVASPEIEAATLLDRGTYFLGPCGSADLRHEAIFSPDLDTLLSVAPLVHSSHRVAVAATGRIAPSLTERCVVFPFDTLQFAERLPVQLFAVIGVGRGVVEASDKRIVSQIKRGFGMMCAGNHKAAVVELKESKKLLSSPGLGEGSSTTTFVLPTQLSAEMESFYAAMVRVVVTMISTASALGDSSQAYARRYLGWPTLEGPAPIAPVFDTSRVASHDVSGTTHPSLTEQLSTLSKMKETRTPRFAKRRSEGGAKASGLFEMAFALDLDEDDLTSDGVSTIGEPSSAPSAVATFTDVPSDEHGGNVAPVAQHYLRHWRRSERVLGRGAFGSVYRALHDNGSIAAMKILPLAASTTDLDELRKELVVTAGQRHENLVQFVDAEVSSEELVVITELLPGGSLEALTNDFGRLPSRVVRRFVSDILRGLSHPHRAGIVHCDVKAANVLVGVDGVAKVADFGSALHPGFEANFGSDAGGDLKIPGTPAYMAPEVARGNAPTPASDIWSFGVMVHELLSGGSRPFNVKQLSQMEGGAFKCISAVGRIQEGGTELREPAKVRLPTTLEDYEAIEVFLSACLQVDAAKRPTCERLLTMEYLL